VVFVNGLLGVLFKSFTQDVHSLQIYCHVVTRVYKLLCSTTAVSRSLFYVNLGQPLGSPLFHFQLILGD